MHISIGTCMPFKVHLQRALRKYIQTHYSSHWIFLDDYIKIKKSASQIKTTIVYMYKFTENFFSVLFYKFTTAYVIHTIKNLVSTRTFIFMDHNGGICKRSLSDCVDCAVY